MMKRFSLTTFFILLAVCMFGQIEKKINKILLKRSFSEFERFAIHPLHNKNKTISVGFSRELIHGFQESIFYIKTSYKIEKGVYTSIDETIKILTKDNLIIYFYFENIEMKNFPKSLDEETDTIYQFKETVKIEELISAYKKVFEIPLNENELFIDTIYYGHKCGLRGVPTSEQEQIFKWVSDSDTSNLYKWLVSTNTEKQIYAVQGFYSLYQSGFKLSEDIQKLIKYVVAKKGTIKYCAQCDGGYLEIKDFVKEFEFRFEP